jgi:hypothetical protein
MIDERFIRVCKECWDKISYLRKIVNDEGDIQTFSDAYVSWFEGNNQISLDGGFTVLQLEAIIEYVKKQNLTK